MRRLIASTFGLRRAPDTKARLRETRKTRKTGTSVRPLLDNGFGICAEIDEQTKLAAGKSKIVHELRAVFFCQSFNGLDLDYDLPVTVEVGNICFLNRHALVKDAKLLLCVERYASCRQLQFKALLVHLFPKPVPKFTIDFIDCTANGVAFFWIYQLSVHAKNYSKSSCGIVSLVSKISCSLRSRRFRVPRRRFSCRGHLTRTEGRDGASPPREGRSDRKGKEQSEECERDLQASEATRRLQRPSRASDAPRFVVARSANTTRAEAARKSAKWRGRARGRGGAVRAKEGCGTNPVLCWAGLPDFLQTEGVENGIITAEGVFSRC